MPFQLDILLPFTLGISRKTQELLLAVSLLRYLDLLVYFYSFYNSFMKIMYICASVLVLVVISHDPVKSTYDATQDPTRHGLCILLPTVLVALAIHVCKNNLASEDFDFMEWCWSISILLEGPALLPQALMFRKKHSHGRVESLTGGAFLFLMGLYRGLYMLNWFYRAHVQWHYRHHYLVYVGAALQVVIGLGGACCCLSTATTSRGGFASLGPRLVQLYKSFKPGWVVTAIFLCFMAAEANVVGDLSRIRNEEHRKRVVALLILSFVAVLGLVCYCGFSTYKEEDADDEESGNSASANDESDVGLLEGGVNAPTKKKKIIKKGIFIHGIQVV